MKIHSSTRLEKKNTFKMKIPIKWKLQHWEKNIKTTNISNFTDTYNLTSECFNKTTPFSKRTSNGTECLSKPPFLSIDTKVQGIEPY